MIMDKYLIPASSQLFKVESDAVFVVKLTYIPIN